MNPNALAAETAAGVAAALADEAATLRATQAGEIKRFEGTGRPYRIKPDGSIDILDALGNGPLWRTGLVSVYTSASFVEYMNRFKDATSLVFADVLARKFTGALSYYPKGPGQAATGLWDRHRVELQLKHTPSWEAWISLNKKEMDQATFAQFLEDNVPDIVKPDGGTLVQIARTLEAKVNAVFESDIRPANGSYSFKYAEDVQSQAGRGTLQIPSEITLGLQVFEGTRIYPVVARFRHKLRGGKLTLWYEMVRIEDVLRTAFGEEHTNIENGLDAEKLDGASEDTLTVIIDGPAPTAAK